MKVVKFIVTIIASVFLHYISYSQADVGSCPNYGTGVRYIDPTCSNFIPTPKEIKLGGARMTLEICTAKQTDFYIPENRPTWAIAFAHVTANMNNILGGEYLSNSYILGIGIRETNIQSDCNAQWAAKYNKNPFVSGCYAGCNDALTVRDGMFQIDESTGWPIYTSSPGWYKWRFTTLAEHHAFASSDHVETAAHLRLMYDLAYIRYNQYFQPNSRLDQYIKTKADPYGLERILAYSWNGGIYGATNIVNNTNIAAWAADNNVSDKVPGSYSANVAAYTQVLDGAASAPAYGSSTIYGVNHEWYDAQIKWSDVLSYINKLLPLYREVNGPTATANVKSVFDGINGGNPVSFRYGLSPVIDALVANFPFYDPLHYMLNDINSTGGCKLSGVVPIVKVTAGGPTTFCTGLDVTLSTLLGSGYTYQWYKNGVVIPSTNANTYLASDSGEYSVIITLPGGQKAKSECNVKVKLLKCSNCTMKATATTTNNSCTGKYDGTSTVTLTNAPAGGFIYTWSGTASGSINSNSNPFTIPNLRDGNYTITVKSAADTTCKGITKITINSTLKIYQTVSIDTARTSCGVMNLTGKIVSNPPSQCQWTFKLSKRGGDQFGANLFLKLALDGVENLSLSDVDITTSSTSLTRTLNVSNGSLITLYFETLALPCYYFGNADKYKFEIFDATGALVFTYSPPSGFSSQGASTKTPITSTAIAASCNQTVPTFTYAWTPTSGLSSTSTLATTATVTGNTYYKITATPAGNPACALVDSALVRYKCTVTCTPPATAPLFKSANFSACAPATGANVIVTLPTGVYYQLFNSTTNAAIGTVAGPTSVAGDVTISNIAAGTYKVRIASSASNLTATGCFTPSVGTGTVSINTLPTLTISSLPNDTVCTGTNVTLKGGGANTYLWDKTVVDNTAFSATTTTLYTLTGTDINGCQATKTINLVVNPTPTVKATATPSSTICQGGKVTLIGTGATNYTWNNGVTNNTAFTPATKTLYTVTGTDAKGCTATDTITIKLSSPPTAAITTTALGYCNTVGASGITLTANPVSGATYQWFKNGTSQGAANTTNTFANATAGNWTVKVAIGTCADSLKTAVTVVANPLPNATATSRATALCLNDTVSLKGASTTPNVTYAWDNGVTNNSPITLDNASKFKTYTLTVTSKDNCTATTTLTLTQKAATAITTNPIGFTACVGENKTLNIVATGAGTLNYQWTLGATTVGTNSPTLTLNNIQTSNAGTYKVSVIGDCGSLNSTDAVVAVNDKPQITKQPTKSGGCVGSNAALNVTATTTGTTTYQWIKNPASNVGTNSNILNFTNLQNTDAGIYKVTITNSCGTVTSDTASITTPSNETPDVELLVSKAQVCEGTTVQLTALVKQGGGTTPKFTFKDGSGNTLGIADQLANTFTTAALTTDQTYTVSLLSNSSCLAPGATNPITSPLVTVKVDTKPTSVSAGADKSICTTTYTLAANPITVGTGKWTVKSGTGNFADNTQNNTTLSNLTVGANEYKWTVTNGVCNPVSDSVIITRTGSMSTPNAGADIKICEGNTVNLSASSLQVGETGTWSITPSTLTIANTASPISTISSTTGKAGTYSIKWTIGNGVCPDQADSLNLTIDQLPSTATLANATLSTCATQLNLNAVAPTVGTGVWKITSGSGNIAAADTSNPTALLTGLSSGATTTLTWSVKNGTCNQANSKTLTINQVGNLSNPVILAGSNAITGTSLAICKNKTYSFTANTPAAGETGTWTSTSNAIVALSGSTQTQNLTITGTGVDTITWTISTTTPGCTPQSKQVVLNISDVPSQPTTIIGDDTLCANAVTTQSVTQVANTNYTWNLQNATGTSNTNAITATIGTGIQAVLTVTPSNTCGNGTARSKTITINSKPLAPVFATSNTTSNPQINPSKVCSQATVNYTVNTVAGETYTWSWKNPSTKTNTDIATGSISTNASNITKSETDTLIVTGTNNCGTGTSKKLAVSFNPLPSYTVPNDTNICQGNALPNLKLSFTGKPSYTVNFTFNGTPVSVTAPANTYLLPSQVGTYQLTSVTDANGCTNATTSKTVTVSQTALPEASYTITGQTVCEGKDANIQISGSESGILYNIYKKGTPRTKVGSTVGTGSAISSTITASNLTSTNIIEIEAVGCAANTLTDTASIKQVGTITAIIGKTTVCDNAKTQTYTLSTVAGASGYTWAIDKDATVTPKTNTSSATVTVGTNSNYTLTATAVLPTGACTNSTASLAISQIASFKGDTLVLSEDTVCAGANITVSLKNKTADVYRNWSFPLNTKINSVNLDSTLFNITLQEQGAIQVMPYHTCNITVQNLQENVEVYKVPQAYAGANQKYNGFPTGVQLKGTNLASEIGVKYKYDWTVTKGNAVLSTPTALQTAVTPKEVETKYLFTITTPNKASCSSSSEVTIAFEVVINPPLIFSPNEDGKNDLWEINELEFFPNASIEIFNQWGTMVYSKNGGYFAEPWNGKYDNGAEAPIATYYYIITPNKDGYNNKAGSVTIVK